MMKKILVIEDSPDVRSLIADMLSVSDYEILMAENGIEGIELVAQQSPDLVLCDVNMPELDGFGVLQRLRENPATATIPFIFLTGASDKPFMRHGMELGADDYLNKPFTLQDLLGSVRVRLEKKEVAVLQAEKKLEELRSNISLALPHELLTPLAGILGFASLLEEDYTTMPLHEVGEAARNIRQAAVRLRRTIENFLLYSQIELIAADRDRTTAMRQGRHSHSAAGMVEQAQNIAGRLKRERDLRIEVDPAVLPIAPEQLEKIIHELLDNAFKFSDAGSEVMFVARVSGSAYVLSVMDRGRGLSTEEINKIGAHMQFERRLHEQQGSGLGLVIVKRLVELHGGRLEIESIPGQRTKVSVVIPKA
jgi:signal transduction histidine kinase